jgi:hypothetical protein
MRYSHVLIYLLLNNRPLSLSFTYLQAARLPFSTLSRKRSTSACNTYQIWKKTFIRSNFTLFRDCLLPGIHVKIYIPCP